MINYISQLLSFFDEFFFKTLAGVMFDPSGASKDGFEIHYQVNFLSHMLLSLSLVEHMDGVSPRVTTRYKVAI